jgi:hypothetical protein
MNRPASLLSCSSHDRVVVVGFAVVFLSMAWDAATPKQDTLTEAILSQLTECERRFFETIYLPIADDDEAPKAQYDRLCHWLLRDKNGEQRDSMFLTYLLLVFVEDYGPRVPMGIINIHQENAQHQEKKNVVAWSRISQQVDQPFVTVIGIVEKKTRLESKLEVDLYFARKVYRFKDGQWVFHSSEVRPIHD